ncbi:hypothetical protein P170DRAFT_420792 [Aspergillus steynii IBT 23096]|uniref:Cyanovirin-N domain-containing protein n=1 Tax=Aspergillus steynii IBT 23096 TaxID=1392250 RepID=A0A2I2GM98_9EURO|nr:uncharacterized protein P170DRAFT_420792 [Aspergillus steynii IBT 23096]PLB54008.1 hypothetical protein P170DRAFT_420792 [Aspergillus steynii IBT 23096]
MKLQQILSILSLSTIVAAGDFYATCNIQDIQENHVLNAKCGGPNGSLRSILDLDKCYGVNADGNLVPMENGKYTGRCQLCSVTYDGEMLCQCLDSDDKTVKTTIDLSMPRCEIEWNEKLMVLDDIISNKDGILHCHVGAGVDGSCLKQWRTDDECP